MNAVVNPKSKQDYYVADISQAEWGRKEMAIAETEMPGLMQIRLEYAGEQPPFRIVIPVGCGVARRDPDGIHRAVQGAHSSRRVGGQRQ